MCDFCDKKTVISSCNFCGNAFMSLAGNVLDVYGHEKVFTLFKRLYRPRFEIDYCPMCGKKLKSLR